jgi:hypothetical protein
MGVATAILRRVRRGRRIWIWIAVAAGLLQVLLGYLSLHPHPFETVAEHAARLSSTHGIIIGYGHPSTFFVPPYGPADARIDGIEMVGADPANLPPALDGVEDALALYPPGFVRRLVAAIFIAGELRLNTERAGGFTGPAWVLLAAPDSSSSAGIRLNNVEGLHHELSSFVLQKTNTLQEWMVFAPADWSFATHNEAALSHGRDQDPSPETGFLSAYGATTAENDFNTYAEKIFTEPKALVQVACQHALIRKKLLFVLHTYVTLDVRLDQVFRGLGIDRARLCR